MQKSKSKKNIRNMKANLHFILNYQDFNSYYTIMQI